MANLQLNRVSKIYPSGALALYKANLELSDSEFVAVVGGEKSGKSTLLRVIAGLEEATDGTIVIGGKDVTSAEPKDRDVAMIFQGNTLYPALSVFDNIAYGLKIRKASQTLIDQRVKAAAEMLGLTDILKRKPKALTAEQKKKVAFARAMVREPKLYLLDDPLAGLDGALKDELRSVLVNIQARMKGTFIYATKSIPEAVSMASRIIVLREGMIQQIDTPANLYDYPANAYVAFLIGSPSINFINGAIIVEDGGKYCVVKDGVKLALPENIVKRFTALSEYANTGKKVIAGLRPEDMTVTDGEGIMSALVDTCEDIGDVRYAECDGEELSFVVRADGVEKGDNVNIDADLSRIMLFDGVTRLTLLERDGGYKKTGYADADKLPLGYDEEEAVKEKLRLPKDVKKKKR